MLLWPSIDWALHGGGNSMSHENVHVVVVACLVFRAVLLIFSMFNCIGSCIIVSFALHQSSPMGPVLHFLVDKLCGR